MLHCIGRWMDQYGDLVAFRLMSRNFVLVADPDAVRTIMHKVINHSPLSNPNGLLVAGKLRAFDEYGLLTAMDETWRRIRNAWQPAFAPASLRGYQELMDREALALTAKLEAAAGEQREVEFLSEISRVTLAVVGTSAYGVDFHSPEFGGDGGVSVADRPNLTVGSGAPRPQAETGGSAQGAAEPSLVQACHDWFRTMSPTRRTKWAIMTALPCLLPLARHIACTFPDAIMALHLQARRVLRKTSLRLMADWRAANGPAQQVDGLQQQQEGASMSLTKPVVRPAGGGVSPGSFLGLMLAGRGKGAGRGLTDSEIEAQVQTFMLAGFETTANALTFAMYLLALHPDKAERLQREVDEHLPPPQLQGPPGGQAVGPEPPVGLEVLDKLVYTEAVINEAMRLYPPAHGTTRLTDKPMNVLGYHIPAGTTLWIPIYHMHRRQSLWPDHEAFRPERFLPDPDAVLAAKHPHAHLPFGSGTRMCIGYRFALQEAKTVLARLFQRLAFDLCPGQVPLELATGLTMAPRDGVRLRVRRRSPLAGSDKAAAATSDNGSGHPQS